MTTKATTTTTGKITADEYGRFQEAFDFFNRELFAGELPEALITLQRKPRMKGYFWPRQFRSRANAETCTDEIAMNPDTFGRTDEEILSTLAHEMCHLWQDKFGTPSRRAYHNQQWAAKMKAIGLQPTDTGEAGGKETGEHVTHLIMPGGAYAIACRRLLAAGYRLGWQATPDTAAGKAKKKQTRAKYTCPECGLSAWAKPGAKLLCGTCTEEEGAPIELWNVSEVEATEAAA